MRRFAFVALLLVAGCTPAPAPAPAPESKPAADVAVPAQDTALPDDAAPPAPVDDRAVAWEHRLGNLPPDAAAIITRVESCTHFSGEFNGDGSDRDRDVLASMEDLQCATIEQEAAALRESHSERPDVIEALDMAANGLR